MELQISTQMTMDLAVSRHPTLRARRQSKLLVERWKVLEDQWTQSWRRAFFQQ